MRQTSHNSEEISMRVVALEEHFRRPGKNRYAPARSRAALKPRKRARPRCPMELLPEIGEQRFKSMDDAGVTVQVLSEQRRGPTSCPAPTASPGQRAERLPGGAVAKHPTRFAALRRCRWRARRLRRRAAARVKD
jgi:hypothetical protein